MRVLVAGWFSFEQMGASAGDLLCRDTVCGWLRSAGIEVVVANAPPFHDGVRWETIPGESVDAVIFVCGPFGNGWPIPEFLAHFAGKRLVGVNLTMLQPLEDWNPFDVLFERDSSRISRPDAVFLAPRHSTPVVGLILVHAQKEYGARGRHAEANQALRSLARGREAALVEIDTRLDVNGSGLQTPGQVESLIAKMDLVFTTRLHGMVLALKNHVPCIVVDPIAGGAKITRQARTIGWPYVFSVDSLIPRELEAAYEACISDKRLAIDCAAGARRTLSNLEHGVISALAGSDSRLEK